MPNKGSDVEYRYLGKSGLRVSTLALGTMTFGGRGGFAQVGSLQLEDARRLVDQALDAGVNLIDTADMYSSGLSEEIVGEVLAGRRERVVVATKVRFAMGSGPNDAGLSRHHIIESCEGSLRRLRTDYIDLYQVHEWDGCTPLEETIGALDDLVHQGKVRYIGCSNYTAWQLMKALGISERMGKARFVSQQIYYSLLHREAEYELVPAAIDAGLGVLVWSPLAGGLLSGKYRRDRTPPAGARHTTDWGEPPVYDWDRAYDAIEALVEVAEERGVSPAQVALAYLLGKPAVTSLVVGVRTEQQLADNLGAADLELSSEERQRLDKVSSLPLLYPYWHQAMNASDRLSPADESLLGQDR
jgi:aryl-alcohol dehydrogenase-like predicted oxidoreductase